MKPQLGFPGLVVSQRVPVRATNVVLSTRGSAGSGRNAMQDRPIERRVDDLVVGHEPLLFNIPNLSARPVYGYGAKRENVQ